MMKKILLDTNFLMIPAQYKVDIFAEIDRLCVFQYELIVPEIVVKELHKVASGQKGAAAAKMALQLVEAKNLHVIPLKNKTLKNADKIILDIANKDDYIVATQDQALKRLLKQKKVPLIVLRQKSHLKLLI